LLNKKKRERNFVLVKEENEEDVKKHWHYIRKHMNHIKASFLA
jgi:hypothetical protein